MAVNAAHFTTTFQSQPSIFEIIAQESLDATFHPALQRLSLFLATNAPQKFGWLLNYYEEAFLALKSLLEYHYIRKYGGSFAETFYGLKRVPIGGEGVLSEHHRQLSLVVIVVLPYLRRKIEEKLSVYRLENAEGALRNSFHDRLKKFALLSHSICHFAWGTWTLANYLRYMSGRERTQLPILSLVGLRLVYSEDVLNADGFWTAFFRGQLTLSELSGGLLRHTIGSALEVAAFCAQFLQTWNTERSDYKVTALPIPPPPKYDHNAEKYRGKCPICLKRWKIPAVLPVSGYVYCFSCILNYLREERKCPVTNLPSKPMDVIRLYDNK